MSKIAYVPFADGGLLSYVQITTSTFNSGRIFDCFKMPPLQYPASLSSVRSGEQLYLFAHGAPASDSVQDNQGNALTMAELAAQLRSSGLRQDIRTIKLNVCNGGTGGEQSTALKFLMAMNAEGYANVSVYGYTESLMVQSEGGSKRGETGARAKDIRVGFQRVGTGVYKNL